MPYRDSLLYVISSQSGNCFYIGSTVQPLNKRFSEHKSKYRAYLDKKEYADDVCTSFHVLENNDAQISLIKHFPCKTKKELLKQERLFIENNPDCVNRCLPGRTTKEYQAQYYKEHK